VTLVASAFSATILCNSFWKFMFGTNFFTSGMEVFGVCLCHCWTVFCACICLSFLFDQNQNFFGFRKTQTRRCHVCPILTSSLNKFLKHCFYLSIKVHYVCWAARMITRVPFIGPLSLQSIPRVVLKWNI